MASALDTTVKTYHNMMGGAPQLNNTRGRLVELLDAVLVNGFGEQNISSATYAPGLMTYTVPENSFFEWQVVTVQGMSDPELNGEFRIVSVAFGSITVAVKNVEAAPVSTTGATVKASPLGYEAYFSVGRKRIYRSKNPKSDKPCLVVYDEAMPGYTRQALWAAVGITRNATSVEPEDFVGSQAPINPIYPKVNWRPNIEPNRIGWYKWYYAMYSSETTATRPGNNQWRVVGDDMFFYFETEYSPNRFWLGRTRYMFGEIVANNPADRSAALIVAESAPVSTNPSMSYPGEWSQHGMIQGWATASTGWRMLASHDQLTESVNCWQTFTTFTGSAASVSGDGGVGWPNPGSGETLMVPVHMMSTGSGVRGILPGAHYMPHDRNFFQDGQIIRSAGPDGTAKRFMITKTQYISTSEGSLAAFDITGPWR